MNPATGRFKGAFRSRYFVSHDISRFERSVSAVRQLEAKQEITVLTAAPPTGWTEAAEGLWIT
jgi:hypothetical protein